MMMHAPALPCETTGLLPHRPPMLLVTQLLSVEGGENPAVVAEATIAPDCPALTPVENGPARLEPEAFVELIAQAFAASAGYARAVAGAPPQSGMLVGLRRVEYGAPLPVTAGATLTIQAQTTGGFGDFSIVAGTVMLDDTVLASAECKLFIEPEASANEKEERP